MASTWRQRYMDTPEENRVKAKFKGKVRMLSIALNYEGTESPLNCTVDADRLTQMAARSGVKDIVKMYDDGSTDKFPCKEEIEQEIRDFAARCKPGDYFVLQYSGHGTTQDNPDEADGLDSLLCLRTREGEDEDWIDDDIAQIIADEFDPQVKVLLLADACCSGGVLDCDTKKTYGAGAVLFARSLAARTRSALQTLGTAEP
ncbi:unnamed protein product [Polarella glacialis]|uniref:Peptidase C14 caspase domain-containing protein n=1 Tax=Polarella glacialis TaxID=89957 RepID=A0A813JMP7_POLGL|nr:unnamed protein product [Polarella glacialis]CAE8680464.1 unnamed protein product [Polarella glacialis]